MKLGIDFGTTRIVAAAVDRGNYPVVQFETPDGATEDWFPPLVAVRGEERRYGWDAWSLLAEPDWTIVRSLKRLLAEAGPNSLIEIGDQTLPLRLLLREMTAALRQSLLEHSTLPGARKEPLEVFLGVPANANSNQRFLTVEGFRDSGHEVLGLLNEPSASSVEFSHGSRVGKGDRPRFLLVYDLGGGTFDVSLVELSGQAHTVLGTEGIASLGGDDFDEVLAELALEPAATGGKDPLELDRLTQSELFRLHQECRQKKEALHSNSRKIVIDLDWVRGGYTEVSVPVAEFYERCRPLVDETLHATNDLLARHGFEEASSGSNGSAKTLEAVYVAGGGSELPLVPRGLRERFGRKVRRSAHAHCSTATGLAIQADNSGGYLLRERFTRFFGVWREAEAGHRVAFDPLFAKETPLPGPKEKPLEIHRYYAPVHDIGHFRYLECSQVSDDGQPRGDITVWDEIRFPFDPGLRQKRDLGAIPVGFSEPALGQHIEEAYSCDAAGRLEVTITNHSSGYRRRFQLGHWAADDKPIKPGRRPGRKKKAKAVGRER